MGNKATRCIPIRQRKSVKNAEDEKQPQPETVKQQTNEKEGQQTPVQIDETGESDSAQPVRPPTLLYSSLYDFNARTEGDLSFRKGDEIEVLNNTDGDWWFGKCLRTNCTGYVPSNYIEPVNSLRSFE